VIVERGTINDEDEFRLTALLLVAVADVD